MPARDRHDPASSDARRAATPLSPWLDAAPVGVLVADEDPAARADLPRLVGAGVDVTVCTDGAEALWQAGRVEPSVVILSATLPVVSAADVAAVLTRHGSVRGAVLVSVAVGEAEQAGPVLAAGATGVVSRPYRAGEIQPLLRGHLERRARVLEAGDLALDGPAFEARAAGRPLRLTLREFELLRLLMIHVGRVVPPDIIRQEIWAVRGETVTANTIAVHVRHLRRHIAGVADIVTVRGVGYRLVDSPAAGRGPRASGLRKTGT